MQVTGGKAHSSAECYKKCVFLSTVGWVRPKTRDKWLKVSHDAGSALIHDVMVHLYRFDCYATSHCKYGMPYGSLARITNLIILNSPFSSAFYTNKRFENVNAYVRKQHVYLHYIPRGQWHLQTFLMGHTAIFGVVEIQI